MKNIGLLLAASVFGFSIGFSQEKPLRTQLSADLTGDGVPEKITVDTSMARPELTIADCSDNKFKRFNHFSKFKGLHYVKDGNYIVYLTGFTKNNEFGGFEIRYEGGEYRLLYKTFTRESHPRFFEE